MGTGYTIGIDLGTTNSAAAAITGETPEVLPNDVGDRTTPSVVAFDDDGPFVGQTAVNQAVSNPDRTVQRIKRHMGDDEFSVDINDEEYTPSEISALTLKRIVSDAEDYLGSEVTGAVITVPAYFGNRQRQATRTAGEIAGLDVERIISEPTAACLAYGLQQEDESAESVLVYDLGGGTFDVSIVDISNGVIEVVATGGDEELGGEDWDDRVVEWILEAFEEESGLDVSDDTEALQRVRENAIEAKHMLSSKSEADIKIPYLADSESFDETLTREKFDELTGDLLDETIERCEGTLADADSDVENIDKVLLVGGSTRMQQVHDAVSDKFGERVSKEVNPDEVVAIGAATQAALLDESQDDDVEKQLPGGDGILLVDVTPKTLGVELANGNMDPLIEKNETIPATVEKTGYTTVKDNQTQVHIRVFEGEHEIATENDLLDDFFLKGIPSAPAGQPELSARFSLDMDGILEVEAIDEDRGESADIMIEGVFEQSEEEIDEMRDALPFLKDENEDE